MVQLAIVACLVLVTVPLWIELIFPGGWIHVASEWRWKLAEWRWKLAFDVNIDGRVTISDAWWWLKWVFFAPGDAVIVSLMAFWPEVARFLELDLSSLYGWLSLLLSLIVWHFVLRVLVDLFIWSRWDPTRDRPMWWP